MPTRTRGARPSRAYLPAAKARSKTSSTKRPRASSPQGIEHLRQIMNKAHVGMLVTRSRDCGMHGRAGENKYCDSRVHKR